MTYQTSPVTFPSVGARMLWHLECWGLKRIDAWGVTFIIGALVLVAHHALTVQTELLLITITANYWLGYWLNDYFDAPHDSNDKIKARQNLFVQRPEARRYVKGIASLVFGGSALIFISFGWRGVVVLLMNFLIMWAYSAPPLRLKSRPGLDLLTHAIFVQSWPYIVCMWLTGAAWTQLDGTLLAICFLTSLGGQLNQQVRDFEVDTRTDTNFATWAGLANTVLILKIIALSAVLFCSLAVISGNIPWTFIPLGLFGLPKVVHLLLRRTNDSHRIFPRYLVYIIMLSALMYMGVLMVFETIA